MTWVKIKEMSSIENDMLHETIVKLKIYADKYGKDDKLYKALYSKIVDMAKEIVVTDNIVIPVTLNTKEPIVVMMELEMLDDGKNYRVTEFSQGEDSNSDSFVKVVVIN